MRWGVPQKKLVEQYPLQAFSLLSLFIGDLWGHYLLLRVNKVIELHSVILPTLTFQDGASRALVV